MKEEKLSKDGSQHVTDEKINMCTHLTAAVFSLLGTVLLIVHSSIQAKPWHIVSFSIYGFSLFAMFLSSTFHHGLNAGEKGDRCLLILDYSSIFLLIAGTITPVALVVLRGALGWSLFGVAWATAVVGTALKAARPGTCKSVTNTLYLAMGWLGAVAAIPVYRALGWGALILLALGGLLYSAGAVIFATEKPNPIPGKFGFHEIWHIFVMLAAAAHFSLMYVYVLPAP